MCRLLGVVTRVPRPLTEALDGLLEPFTALSREHADGWGIAARSGREQIITRGTDSAHASPSYRAATEAVADAALLHLRLASPGSPIRPGNTHPFVAGTLAFAHNGFFSPREALDDLIEPELLAGATGDTDSERFFLRVLSRLRSENTDPVDAIAHTAADIQARATFGSLNCLLLTEGALYAYAQEDPESEVSRRRGPEFFRMHYRIGPIGAVVTSNGVATGREWETLPYGRILEIRRSDLRVSTHAVTTGLSRIDR
ncbi:class II glutamine amidotransferase [Nocardia miyunensis]|uniref:class II glutamine amidotransferase n=1 Tax=Nocardia miyunensis TaxID=282684 RepID=UPI00082F17B4|nr:class II glutamine amidotransferase [Nocardia miyunensis]